MDELLLVFSLAVAPWLLAGWFRIPRYVSYFQHEDYDSNRYLLLIGKTAEFQYFITFVILLGILFFVSCCPLLSLGILMFRQPVATVVVYLGLFVIALSFAPRRLPIEQKYRRETRAVRLMIITFWIELIPVLITLGLIWGILSLIFDPKNSPESMILAFGFVYIVIALGVCAGPIGFALTPYSVVFGHLVNRLIEAAFMRRLV